MIAVETASPATVAARAFVEAHRSSARRAGESMAAVINEPVAFRARGITELTGLADPAFAAGLRFVAPGIGPALGVRQPLLTEVHRGLARALRRVPSEPLLRAAAALATDEVRDLRWLAIWLAGRAPGADAEAAWMVFRRVAGVADEWITVDSLAGAMARGIVREPARWEELDRLVASESRWQRRLVGSTIASIPFADRTRGRSPAVVTRGLGLVRELIGDPEPDVQKALSWALRSLALADPDRVAAFCLEEAERAAAARDGDRAWVLRDSLARIPAAEAAEVRRRVAGLRRNGRPARGARAAAAVAAGAATAAAAAAPEPPSAEPIGRPMP